MADVNQPGYGCYPPCGPGYGRRGFSTFFLVILVLLLFPSFFGGFGY